MKLKLILTVLLFTGLSYSCSMNEGGVRTANNMEKYALDYIAENKLLEEGEKISAYYDYTISLDGTEAVLLTDLRLIHHNKETQTTAIDVVNIVDVRHTEDTLIGDIIEVTTNSGDIMMIEIAPLNQGETFLRVLNSKLH